MALTGFVGLGIMGMPMARNLFPAAGGPLLVYDLDAKAVETAGSFGATASTLREIAQSCGVVFLSLPNAGIVERVLFGDGGLATNLAADAVVCDLGTNSPGEARAFAARLAEAGGRYVDAPVSGGESKAIAGELTVMVGGGEADCAALAPFFAAIGSHATYFGTAGGGCMAKAVNQILVHVNLLAICEAFALAEKAGLDLDALYGAFRGGSAGSAMLDNRIGKFLSREFEPGARISTVHKDIAMVLDAARRADMPVPLTSVLFDMLKSGMARGMADRDITAMITLYEWLGNARP